MKIRHLFVLLFAGLIIALSSCSKSDDGAATSLEGTPEEILNQVLEAVELPMPMSFVNTDVNPEMSQNALGLSPGDFERLVEDVAISTAAIMTHAHEVAIIKAKDAAAAKEAKDIIAGDGGYDAGKWICVFPGEAGVVESGPYVLLVASEAEVADAIIDAFKEAAVTTGEVNIFFTGGFEGDMNLGGMGITIGD